MMKEIKGVSFLFSETGTEGGWWAMLEDGSFAEDGDSYEGLQYLKEGHDFTLYADDGSVLFHGIINQDAETGAIPRQVLHEGELVNDQSWKQQVARGMWVQRGIDPKLWGNLFTGNKRCLIKREEET